MAINREKVLETAQKLIDKRKLDKAVIELKRVVDVDPSDTRTLQRIGDLQLKQGLHREALDTFDSVGRAYGDGGFAPKAIAIYKQMREIITTQAPQLEERYAHIYLKLADLHQQLGLNNETRALLEDVAKRLASQQRDRDALLIYQRLAAIDGNNPLAHLRVAEGLARAGDVDGAVASFKAAASLLVQLERRDDAIQVLERLLFHKPDPEQARLCAELYLTRNHPHDATHALTKLQIAFQAAPKDLDILGLVARAFEGVGQAQQALQVRKEQARVARETGRQDILRSVVTYLLRIAPQDPEVRQLAGSVYP